jgi:hypothetical protein
MSYLLLAMSGAHAAFAVVFGFAHDWLMVLSVGSLAAMLLGLSIAIRRNPVKPRNPDR